MQTPHSNVKPGHTIRIQATVQLTTLQSTELNQVQYKYIPKYTKYEHTYVAVNDTKVPKMLQIEHKLTQMFALR